MLGCNNRKIDSNCIMECRDTKRSKKAIMTSDKKANEITFVCKKIACNGLLVLSFMTASIALSGCGKEITDVDIKNSKLYQDLETDYTKLQRKYDKLEKKSKKKTEAVDSDVVEYLDKMKASHFVKLSYALHGSDISDIIENKSLVKQTKDALADAIVVTNESVADCKKNRAYQYIYTFYNEDNSLCKCDIYEGDRVIFEQFQDKVFWVEGITKLGDGMIKRQEAEQVIASSIYTTLYHAQLGFLGENVMTQDKLQEVVSELYAKDYQALEERPVDAQGEPKKMYTYYVDGKKYLVHVYDQCFSVEDDETNVAWYGKVAEDTTEENADEATSENSGSRDFLDMQ